MTPPTTRPLPPAADELPVYVSGTANYAEIWTRDKGRLLEFAPGITEALERAEELQRGRV